MLHHLFQPPFPSISLLFFFIILFISPFFVGIDFSCAVQRTTRSSISTFDFLIPVRGHTRMRQDSWLFFLEFFLLLYLCFAGLLSFSLCFFLFSVWTTTTTGTSATGRNGRISVPDGHWWTRERRQNNVKNSNNTLKQGAKVDVKIRDTVTNRNTGEEVNKGNESQRRFPFIWRMTPDFIITLIFSCCPIAYPILSPVHYIVRHMWNTKVPLCLLVCYDYRSRKRQDFLFLWPYVFSFPPMLWIPISMYSLEFPP